LFALFENLEEGKGQLKDSQVGVGTVALIAKFCKEHQPQQPAPAPSTGNWNILVPTTAEDESGIDAVILELINMDHDFVSVSEQKKTRVDPVVELKDRFLNLKRPVDGEMFGRTQLYLRPPVEEVVSEMIEILPKRLGHRTVLGGSRGEGKSIVGTLVAAGVVRKGEIVGYHYKGTMILAFNENVDKRKKEKLDKCFDLYHFVKVSDNGGVFSFLGDLQRSFFLYLVAHVPMIYVHDVDTDSSIPAHIGESSHFIVTSPNSFKLRDVKKQPGKSTWVFLESWTEPEIKKLKPLDDNVTDQIVMSRFRRVGGIPRWVVDAPKGDMESTQDQQIANLSMDMLGSFIHGASYGDLPSQVGQDRDPNKSTDMLFRIEPTNDRQRFNVVFASNYVASEILYRFVEQTEFQNQVLFSSTNKEGAIAQYRGHFLEAFCHQAVGGRRKDVEFKIRPLSEHVPVAPDFAIVEGFGFQSFVGFERINNVQVEKYYRPRKSNYPTVDSFAVVTRAWVEKHFVGAEILAQFPQAAYFLICFQVTISETHVVDGTVLKQLRTELISQLPSGTNVLPMLFIFVTTASGITKRQVVTRKEKGGRKAFADQSQFGPQYALILGNSFENMLDRFRDKEQVVKDRLEVEASQMAEDELGIPVTEGDD